MERVCLKIMYLFISIHFPNMMIDIKQKCHEGKADSIQPFNAMLQIDIYSS